jgi:mRNA-degrading endonuclease toxin of MazEF toxin-antitoxin module
MPRLADAQRAVATELGFASWPALVSQAQGGVLLDSASDRAGALRDAGLSYLPGRPVLIRVRRRAHRYDIDDMGDAVAIAGRPTGWLDAARAAVKELGWNINRDGVVCMHAVEGRDIDGLVRRTGQASVAVLEALLALEE